MEPHWIVVIVAVCTALAHALTRLVNRVTEHVPIMVQTLREQAAARRVEAAAKEKDAATGSDYVAGVRHDLKVCCEEREHVRKEHAITQRELAEAIVKQRDAELARKRSEARSAALLEQLLECERVVAAGGKADGKALPQPYRPPRGVDDTGAHRVLVDPPQKPKPLEATLLPRKPEKKDGDR